MHTIQIFHKVQFYSNGRSSENKRKGLIWPDALYSSECRASLHIYMDLNMINGAIYLSVTSNYPCGVMLILWPDFMSADVES